MEYLDKVLSKSYAPRWLILLIDTSICTFSFILAFLLAFNFEFAKIAPYNLEYILPLVILVRLLTFKFGRTYSGIIRYTSIEDALRIFITVASGSFFFALVNLINFYIYTQPIIPFAVIITDFAIALLLMTSFRIFVKIVHSRFKLQGPQKQKKKVVIFGAGRSGLITKRTLDQDGQLNAKVIAFLDDDHDKSDKFLEGIPIYCLEKYEELDAFLENNQVEELILSIQQIPSIRKKEIIEICLKHNIHTKVIPPVNSWINGELSIRQIQEINIEDLMERDPINLGFETISEQIEDSAVMVTGASGSIGSELVRQLIRFRPSKLILVDIAESPLHDLQVELEDLNLGIKCFYLVCDVRNRKRIAYVMKKYRPEFVYHVAAYKHVPLMEANSAEAVLTNVWGTRNVADLAMEYGVKKFVMISTDKAVNPTNVMGASKRIAEIYIQSLNIHLNKNNQESGNFTRFVTTRFGNVLGSNGSVIPRFKKQIKSGGPLTVTHPEISRYFMTIPEACQLILEAGSMGKGGEIYIFDMGELVKIVDLAKKMIQLSGFVPDKDIKIVYTGLRPGEKIKEELLNQKENTIETHHPKILIARVREYPYGFVAGQVDELIQIAKSGDDISIVSKMKQIVPEYISQNSIFESLDKINVQS